MRAWIAYAVTFVVVAGLCGIAAMDAGRDNACAALGGHVRGVFAQECVRP